MPSVTRRKSSSREARREALRSRLLDTVERLIGDGEVFAELSVERLVSEAGVSRSTFYVYFEDKGDLLTTWFEEVSTDLADVAAAWWDLDSFATIADLHAVLDQIVRKYRPHMTLMAAVYDTASYDPSVQSLVDSMMGVNIAGLRKHIRAGQEAGFVDPNLAPQETSAWLTWMAERGFHQLVRTADEAGVDRLIDAYTSIVWNTLYGPTRV